MKKSINIVLIGVLTVASLLLALPFTPLRNSFTTTTTKYTNKVLYKIGVDFDGKIKNARTITGLRNYQIDGFKVPENNRLSKKTGKVANYTTKTKTGYNATYSVNSSSEKENITPATEGMYGTGFNSTESKKVNATKSIEGININTVSTKLATINPTAVSTNSTKQAGLGSSVTGGTHPGVDPTSPPPSLPIGDGVNYMLLLLIIFTGLKTKKIIFN